MAQTGDHAQPVGGLQLLLDEESEAQPLDGILADGGQALAVVGEGFATAAQWLGGLAFAGIGVGLYRGLLRKQP